MRTEARVAFDATAIYVAVHAFDPDPDRIVGLPHPARCGLVVGLGPRADRLVSRSSDGVPVRGEPGWRQAGYLLVQRFEQRRQLGCRLGGRVATRQGRVVRGVPHSVFAASFQPRRRRRTGLRGDAKRRPPERDHNVAAPVKERERVRLVVRRVEWASRSGGRRSGSSSFRTSSAKSARRRWTQETHCRTVRTTTCRSV